MASLPSCPRSVSRLMVMTTSPPLAPKLAQGVAGPLDGVTEGPSDGDEPLFEGILEGPASEVAAGGEGVASRDLFENHRGGLVQFLREARGELAESAVIAVGGEECFGLLVEIGGRAFEELAHSRRQRGLRLGVEVLGHELGHLAAVALQQLANVFERDTPRWMTRIRSRRSLHSR